MKRIFMFLLTATAILALFTNICAAREIEESDKITEIEVAQIIKSQLTDSEKEIFSSSKDLDLSNEPILKVYREIFWFLADKPLKEIVSKADEYNEAFNYKDYYVLSETPYKISVNQSKVVETVSDDIPQYIKDIATLSKQVTVNGKQTDVKGIYCFDEGTSYQGIVVYVMTESEALVKYYENSHAEAQLFSESQFREYAVDYYAYITSYEYNYDENGEPLSGVLSFKDFVDGKRIGNVDGNTCSNNFGNTKDENTKPNIENHDYLWLVLGLPVMIIVIIVSYGIYHRKKHNR